MSADLATVLVLSATVTGGIAAGATLDQAIKQLPARRRIGVQAYLSYARAADLSNGLVWYPAIGIGTALVTVAAVITGLLDHPGTGQTLALSIAGFSTIAHLAITSKAAPICCACGSIHHNRPN